MRNAWIVMVLVLLAAGRIGAQAGAAADAGGTTDAESTADAPRADDALRARVDELTKSMEALKRDVVEARALVESRAADVQVTAELTLSTDLLTGGTALTNENTIDLYVPLVTGTVSGRESGDPLSVTLSLYRIDLSATETGLDVAPGKVDARLTWGDIFILLSQAPEFLLDKAPSFSSRPEDARENAVTAAGGCAVGWGARGTILELRIGSPQSDPRQNYANQFGFGLDYEQRIVPRLLSLEAGATYGLQAGYIRDREAAAFTSKDAGFSVKPKLLFPGIGRGIEASVAGDLVFPYDPLTRGYGSLECDARADCRVLLSEKAALPDKTTDQSRLGAGLYCVPQGGICDVQLTLMELPGDAGFVPRAGFDATVVFLDLLGATAEGFSYEIGGGVEVTLGTSGVTPFIRSSYGSAADKALLGVGVKASLLKGKVELCAEYDSEDINHYYGDMGTLSLSCKVAK